VWQGFGSRGGGAAGVAAFRRCQKLPPCPTGLLAKAEPMRGGGSPSVITYLRRGEKNCSRVEE